MQVEVTAYAKVNLLLDVLYRRDDGYHEVEMVMQTIGLSDQVLLEPARQYALYTDNELIPHDQTNLAFKAALIMSERFQTPPVAVTLDKRIPVAAGLAGGSTDAAAVLLGMNALYDLRLSSAQLMALAAELGSDVPFCLSGPTALATGRGEKLKPLPECPKLWLVLVKPPFGVSTPSVYQHLDFAQLSQHPDLKAYLKALERQDVQTLLKTMSNVLEQSTFKLHPQVAEVKRQMQSLGGTYTLMSGSGPTVFSAFSQEEEASAFYHRCQQHFEQVYWTETVTSEQLVERVILR